MTTYFSSMLQHKIIKNSSKSTIQHFFILPTVLFSKRLKFMEKINRDPKNPKWRKKSKWRQTWKFLLKKRLKRHLSSKFKTIFECNSMNINPMSNLNLWNFIAEFQDGGKIQNGIQNLKNLIFAAKWPILNGFQKYFLRFVCSNSVHEKPLSLKI